MISKVKKYISIEIVVIFIITLIFNLCCNSLTHDEVWVYGFSYNISNGMIPYKDFNMVVTPLFSFLGAFFLFLFGKNMVIFHIFNAIICLLIFNYMKKNNPKSYLISYGILLFFALPNYSLFCILLLYIIMDMEEKKCNNYFIGIVLALIFLTKQNIGIYFLFPTLITKNFKIISKRFIGFIIPNLLLILYLIYNNCLYDFINYTFLGITSFASNNTVIYFSCLFFIISIIIYLIYKYFKTRDIKIIYLICIQGLAFPIIDQYHVMLPFVAGFNFFLSQLNLNKKILLVVFYFFIVCVFSYNIYIYSFDNISYPNSSNVFKYRKLDEEFIISANTLLDYISKRDGEIFIINMYAYLINLESGNPIDKYDLLNDGNLGKNGEKKIIAEFDNICKNEKCTFILEEIEIAYHNYSQYNQEIFKYIVDNYEKTDIIMKFSVYTNYG